LPRRQLLQRPPLRPRGSDLRKKRKLIDSELRKPLLPMPRLKD